MNDRERAQMLLLRQLIRLDHGEVCDEITEAIQHLAIAIDADVVAVATADFERVHALQPILLDEVRARMRDLLATVTADSRTLPIRDATYTTLWVPLVGLTVLGMLYAHTRGVFVDGDAELARLFAVRLEGVAHELASSPNLRLDAREHQYHRLRRVLERNGGNLSSAARELGVARAFLYRLLNRRDPDEE